MENQKKMQFYGGTFGACLPLLVFMALMITIAALQKVSLVLFCMAGFAGLCTAFLLAKDKKEFEKAVVAGLKNDTPVRHYFCLPAGRRPVSGAAPERSDPGPDLAGDGAGPQRRFPAAGRLYHLRTDLHGLRHLQRRHCGCSAGAAARGHHRGRQSCRCGGRYRQRRHLRRQPGPPFPIPPLPLP